jgi:hypothetical protein
LPGDRPVGYPPGVRLAYLGAVAVHLLAIPVSMLPKRWWRPLEAVPVHRMAAPGGLFTVGVGLFLGARGMAAYFARAADAAADATLKAAQHQLVQGVSKANWISTVPMQGVSGLSIFAFLLFTPLGWLSTYLVVSGVYRAIAASVEDPFGDPILTGVDTVIWRTRRTARASGARRARERLEGPEVPDRLYKGDWAKLPAVDYVLVASRRKPEWTKGAFVITSDGWYRLGEAFDLRLPEGLRTVYPLTLLKTNEVLRRGVAYELPSLSDAQPWLGSAPSPPARPDPSR